MLYYLFDYLDKQFNLIGAGVFQYISFRAGMAAFLSLLITITLGEKLIHVLRKKQVGEDIRDLGLKGQMQKKGTPTMGGIIIIGAILVPTLLFAKLDNVYVILLIIATCWLGLIGFLDDYIKVFRKNKEGLAGRFKIIGQIGLGLIVGLTCISTM
jgi:phospho-N-acetylmuramoyl-pentapeptide-transferase